MKHISKGLYIFSFSTWIANFVLHILGLFVDIKIGTFLLVFISFVIQAILSGAANGKLTKLETPRKTWLDRIVLILHIVASIVFAVCFAIGFAYGGSAKIVDGNYCVVNKGSIIATISQKEYVFLRYIEYFTIFGGLTVFVNMMFKHVRTLYILQQNNQTSTQGNQ
ncbi:MAG: hypothetical protein IJE50_00775 [Clostridia bacterium]|nr:hypothetical protein [Clostridia bacterium]MBQ3042726.1 hypothetical protein [Clostridia bacterium]